MSVIDTLTILVEADARGIETTLKKTLGIVTGTIGQMNKQEVDWTSIFTRAISPALIAGVASVFAFAISQSLAFQQAMNTTGTAAGESGSQIALTGQAALGMSSNVGQSAQGIANAMLQVSAIFGVNTDATKAVSQAMAQLADSGFGNLNDIVNATIPLFKEFGVSTEQDAINMLTSLMHAAEGARESIPALTNQFAQFAPPLIAAGASVSSFNGLIASFGGIIQASGLPSAQAQFKALADSANSVVGPMELLGVKGLPGVRDAIKSGDLINILDSTANKLNAMGSTAYIVATNFGFAKDQIDQFNIRAKNLATVDKDIMGVATNTQTIKQAWDQSDNAIREFMTDWNKLVALVTSGNLGSVFMAIAKSLGTVVDGASDLVNGKTGEKLFDLLHDKSGLQYLGSQISPLISNPYAVTDPLATALSGSGLGFNSDAISKIEANQSSGNIASLISALGSGISSPNGSTYNNIKTSFNLSLPNAPISAKDLAQILYAKFQGTQH